VLRLLAAGVAGIALLAPSASRPFPHFSAGCVRADFRSGGVLVRAERCGPASGPRAVVVLHGCGGFGTFDHRLAVDLPALGIATLYVDYFAPTPPPGTRGFCGGFAGSVDPFPLWQRVAADAAAVLRSRYAHVGAVGWSLGAGVALATAEDTHAFAAVAAFSALADPPALAGAERLPPTIFLDGGPRDIVRPANARAWYAAARSAHVPTALYVYPDGNHEWKGRQGELGRLHAAVFLRRWLR
jgi:dienelactone hydrolase